MNKKRIVCFGDSNTWGYDAHTGGRFDDDVRWTQIAHQAIGENYLLIEEGLSGRTTVFEDPINEGLRGIDYFYPCLMSHAPLDLLIIMLGTNDTKERFSATPENIVNGLEQLIKMVKISPVWRNESPCILIIAPIAIDERCYASAVAGEMGKGSVEKSQKLPQLMAECAELNNCAFLDSNDYAGVNHIDFMHLDREGHKALGQAVALKIRELLE